jgi:cytochrome c oxidase cbb3-type subunit 3
VTSRGLPRRAVGLAVLFAAAVTPLRAQGPAGSVGPRPNVGPADRPLIAAAAVERGRVVWMAECAACHGPTARGSDRAPSLVTSLLVLTDRQGSQLGPFLKNSHPTTSGRASASFTDAEVADLMQFVRQRINDTLRGSPVFEPGNILTGHPADGRAYFAGPGGCTACHSATGDLAGIGSRYDPVDLQQRMLFPPASRVGRSVRGAASNRTTIRVTVTSASMPPLAGVLVDYDDFFVTLRDDAGVVRTVRREPTVRIDIDDPLRAHHDWLDRVTDRNIHDLVAYLVTLK